MSKASNPTRPAAAPAGVLQQLDGLSSRDRQNLAKWGYPIQELRRVAEADDQADAVDALLAIMLARPGYEHDDRDLKMATRVSKTLNAPVNPRAMLGKQGKVDLVSHGRYSEASMNTKSTWRTSLAGLGVVLGVIVVFAVVFLIVK
jgi:hypothetical protein